MMRVLEVLWLALGLSALDAATTASAQAAWEAWQAEAEVAREVINAGVASPEALESLQKQLESQRDAAAKIAEDATADIEDIQAELDALGPAPEEGQIESLEAAQIRSEISARLTVDKTRQGRALRVTTQTRTLLADVASLSQKNFMQRLENLSPSPALPSTWSEAFEATSDVVVRLSREVYRNLTNGDATDKLATRAPLALLALLVGLFLLFGLRGTALRAMIRGSERRSGRSSRLLRSVILTAARAVLTGLAAGLIIYGVGSLGLLGQVGDTLLRTTGQAVAVIIFTYALSAGVFSPESAGLRLFKLDDEQARGAFRATMMLAIVIAVDQVLSTALDILNASAGAWSVLTLLSVSLGTIALYRLASQLKIETPENAKDHPLAMQGYRVLRRVVLAVCFATPVLALIGYSYAARYIFFPTATSIGVIAIAYLIFALIREVVDLYFADDEEGGDRFHLIPVMAGIALFCIVVPILALIWGASILDLRAAYDAASGELVLGDFELSLIDLMSFALIFGIGYTLTRAAQRVMSVSILPQTRISEGGASALVSGIGYVGVFLAAIVAISATGTDLSSLAIVFGALSVGIGFGLQNIVNNFVSGVILLVERPIKVGDWIDVGGQSGYVKQVNVRSTEIETFDRASYIVPNSDLISSPVLNWTHSNKVGRVRNKVGVAYGTDVRKVERILLDIGRDHPMVINNPAPIVYFMGFGADSLDFELRVYLNDVNWMLSVMSDLNFRINDRFAAEGIEIPFAQRDLHLKNPEALMEIVDRRAKPGGSSSANG